MAALHTPGSYSFLRSLTLIWMLLLLVTGFSLGGMAVYRILGPGPLTEPKQVLIPKGSTMRSMAYILEDEGVVRNWWSWWLLARGAAVPSQLKAGEYAFPQSVSLWDAVNVMRSGNVVVRKITVPEGTTSIEVAGMLMALPTLDGAIDPMPAEGSLLPETYHYQRGETRMDVIARMQDAMEQVMAEEWPKRADGLPYTTPQEALTLASIIEKETGKDAERRRIAGVFVNRLKQGIRLQSDPTTIYALTGGKGSMQGIMKRNLARSDWKLAHPYNTYHVVGLPPGPIANPGRESVRAALNPEKNDYIFFMADGLGGHTFSSKLTDHNKNIEVFRQVIRDKREAKEAAEKAAAAAAKSPPPSVAVPAPVQPGGVPVSPESAKPKP